MWMNVEYYMKWREERNQQQRPFAIPDMVLFSSKFIIRIAEIMDTHNEYTTFDLMYISGA